MVAARCLPLAVREIEQVEVLHRLKPASEFAVNVIENQLGSTDQVSHVLERLERRAALRIGGSVPRFDGVDAERGAAFVVQFAEQRHHLLLNGILKRDAVGGRVIKTAAALVGVIAVIAEAGVRAHLVSQAGELVELAVDGSGLLESAVGHEFPCVLSAGAIRFLEVTAHLDKRLLLAVELYRQAADDFLVLLPQLGSLCFQRDIFASEQLDLERGVAGEHLVALGVEFAPLRVLGQRLGQSKVALLFLRFDLLDEFEVGGFRGLVLGLAGHCDVTLGAFLGERGGEFLPVQDGLLELGRVGRAGQLLFQLIEQWFK